MRKRHVAFTRADVDDFTPPASLFDEPESDFVPARSEMLFIKTPEGRTMPLEDFLAGRDG